MSKIVRARRRLGAYLAVKHISSCVEGSMAIPLNPYVAGNPVGDSPAFVGRVDALREVLRVLRRSQDNAVVLYGQRRIGKTSILQHLAAWLSRIGPYRPVYFDLQDQAAWPLGRVLRELATHWLSPIPTWVLTLR
jgi:hypothetical protein